jgi:hypothetical protein
MNSRTFLQFFQVQIRQHIYALLISKVSSACFGQHFAHLQEHKTEIYSMWYSVLMFQQVGVRRAATWHYVFGMKDIA